MRSAKPALSCRCNDVKSLAVPVKRYVTMATDKGKNNSKMFYLLSSWPGSHSFPSPLALSLFVVRCVMVARSCKRNDRGVRFVVA